jgi:hypothetical protein
MELSYQTKITTKLFLLNSIENNLSLANMGFEEFAGSIGADGVFRGFEERS